MRTMLVGVVGSLVALVGFASTANASATVDLIWAGGGTNTTIATSASATLNVVLTNDVLNIGGSVSVDYSAVAGKYQVTSIVNNPNSGLGYLPAALGPTSDLGGTIESFNAGAIIPYLGTGLPGGQSYLLGTVTFHKVGPGTGGSIFAFLNINDSISIGTVAGTLPASQVQLGSATLTNPAVPEPGTVSLLALGLAGLALAGHRKN